MYTPPLFAESELSPLHDLMESRSFALLISPGGDLPVVSHLPLLIDRPAGPRGTLLGHMARANSQWRGLDGQPVLAIFSGPHSYVSPRWYEAGSAPVVPTWNYVAVHASGRVEIVDDREGKREIVRRSVDLYEQALPAPWTLPTGEDYDRLLDQIVGFRIVIDAIEGKWKISQNQPIERQQKVAQQLQQQGDPDSRAIAELMQQRLGNR